MNHKDVFLHDNEYENDESCHSAPYRVVFFQRSNGFFVSFFGLFDENVLSATVSVSFVSVFFSGDVGYVRKEEG